MCLFVAAATAACGGTTGAFVGPPTSGNPTPAALTASPAALALSGAGAVYAQTAQVLEAGYSGVLSETDTCAGVASVTPASGSGPAQIYTVTGVAAGTCSVRVADANAQHATIAVTVTTAGIGVNGKPR